MKLIDVDYNKRIYGLDVFRAIAILIVVIGHGGAVTGDLFFWIPNIPLVDGVELFFVLSGFLIGTIVIKLLDESQLKTFPHVMKFWSRRWLRTIPLYYVILIINYLLIKYDLIAGDISQFSYKFLLFLQNFNGPFYDFFWESWSLAIEEWFYIFLPLIVVVLSKWLNTKQTIFYTVLILLITPLVLRFNMLDREFDIFWFSVSIKKVVIYRLDAIGYGVLFAYLNYYYPKKLHRFRIVLFVLGISIIYLSKYFDFGINGLYGRIFHFSLLPLAAGMLLPLAYSVKDFKRPIFGKAITFISVISYSMYLVNLALVAQVLSKNFNPTTIWHNFYLFSAYWIITFLLSYFFYRVIERPFMNLRK